MIVLKFCSVICLLLFNLPITLGGELNVQMTAPVLLYSHRLYVKIGGCTGYYTQKEITNTI